MLPDLGARDWCALAWSASLAEWANAARLATIDVLNNPAYRADWRHGGTWCVGVDVLPNTETGQVGGVDLPFLLPDGVLPWHRAQVSICTPGYPGRDPGESDGAVRYRQRRDGAHVDGLLPVGPDRRRILREAHGFVLGLPLTDHDPGASPLVVWEGSAEIMRAAFEEAFRDIDPVGWSSVDVTHFYHAARARCFESCARRVVFARPGEGYLVHRLALHGMAPWAADVAGAQRKIAYFRPHLCNVQDWLAAP